MWLIEEINKSLKTINWLISDTKQKLEAYRDLPDATLVCQKKGRNQTLYYYEQIRVDNKQVRKAIGKIDAPKVKLYKERRFYSDMLDTLLFDKDLLENTVKNIKDFTPAAIHKQLPSSYKNLPDCCYKDVNFEELKAWAVEKYKRNPYPLPADPNIARDGTAMRSKGECMWYDNSLYEELPFRTEPELVLKGKSGRTYKFHPDFVFKCHDGTYIIVEHLGKLDDDQYAQDFLQKLRDYLDCGYVLGDNLIVTSDNINHRTNELMIVNALEMIKKRVYM